ncbi:MAG TPA: pseudouridine synthase [Candidatus Paceibacterota bacterium]|nr:pseudouridine synthase [Candidatus Paceibacterota bacterium]
MRLNKFLAHAGYATRRSADALIEAGRVFVNGKRAVVGQKVTETDKVELKDYDATNFRYLLYYKPRGVITHSPEGDEVDIETRIRRDCGVTGVFPVGRLDKDSEGLIILTNDGRITGPLLSPEHGHERVYEVDTDKRVTQTFLNALAKGVDIEGYRTKPAKADFLPGNEHGLRLTLTEGKKHQVRRMCAALGYQVRRLRRVRIDAYELKRLKPGAFYELSKKEAAHFRRRLGLPA